MTVSSVSFPAKSSAIFPEPLPENPPAIVLVKPQLGENIGKTARAMLNFALSDLRLVAPRDGWPNPAALPASSGADAVLAGAKIFSHLAAAVADCTTIYATSVRKRSTVKPVFTPEQAAQAIHSDIGRSALVFGPERSGLDSADTALAHALITVPVNPAFASLNLAQAVIVIAYEWSKKHRANPQDSKAQRAAPEPDVLGLKPRELGLEGGLLEPPARHAALEGLITHLYGALNVAGYFYPPERTSATKRTLRSALTKARWSEKEVRMMRGILTALSRDKHRDKRRDSPE